MQRWSFCDAGLPVIIGVMQRKDLQAANGQLEKLPILEVVPSPPGILWGRSKCCANLGPVMARFTGDSQRLVVSSADYVFDVIPVGDCGERIGWGFEAFDVGFDRFATNLSRFGADRRSGPVVTHTGTSLTLLLPDINRV